MKIIPLILAATSLSGCTFLSAAGITPQSAPMILAVAAETKAGADVIRAHAAGDTLKVQLACFRIRQARTAADGTIVLQMSNEDRASLAASRALTEAVCAEAGVPLPPAQPVTTPSQILAA